MVVFTLDFHGPWGCPVCPPGPEDAVPEQPFLLLINKSTLPHLKAPSMGLGTAGCWGGLPHWLERGGGSGRGWMMV